MLQVALGKAYATASLKNITHFLTVLRIVEGQHYWWEPTWIYVSITKEYKDVHENYYVMCITIKCVAYGIGSVYGPNQTSREFFRNMSSVIRDMYNLGIVNIIIGGDWNTT